MKAALLFALLVNGLHCAATEVRVRNASNVDFKDVRIEDRYYRHIKAGETSPYFHLEHAFTDVNASATVGGVEMRLISQLTPRRQLGEGKFTFTLAVVNGALSGSEAVDVPALPSPVPVARANPQSPKAFHCAFAMRDDVKESEARIPQKSTWRLFGNTWQQRIPSPFYNGMESILAENTFTISGQEKVSDRSGIVIVSTKDPSLEVFIPDTGAPEPTLYYRKSKGKWRPLGRMEHIE